MDSAITKQGHDCKEFLLRDDRKDAVKCLFYEVVSILKGLVFLQYLSWFIKGKQRVKSFRSVRYNRMCFSSETFHASVWNILNNHFRSLGGLFYRAVHKTAIHWTKKMCMS